MIRTTTIPIVLSGGFIAVAAYDFFLAFWCVFVLAVLGLLWWLYEAVSALVHFFVINRRKWDE
jgi:hypothetical protein